MTAPVEVEPTTTPDEIVQTAKPWVTIVWNDPVNLMSYVTYVFQKYFGYSKKKAEKLMIEVHEDGKSVVSHGSREEMERDVQAMHEYGLWATWTGRTDESDEWIPPPPAQQADHRELLRVRGRPAALLAGQLVELLRNEAAVPRDDVDPFEALMDFSGPTQEPEDPVLARLFPTAYPDDEEAAAEFRRFTEGGLRDGKAAAAVAIIDGLEEAGLPQELTEDGLMIDVELDEPTAEAWMRSFTDLRLALATRLEVEEGDEAYWTRCPTTTRAPRRTTSTSGSATSRRPSSQR